MMKKYLIFAFLLGIGITSAHAGKTTLDDFNSLAGWRTIASDEVRIDTSLASGYSGKCIRIDFNFVAGSGYCGITKNFTMTLPENYEFSFYIRGAAPVNNLEFKLVDSTGDNVWWLNQRNFDFPEGWKKIVIRKRHITFAWGPAKDRTLRRFQRIEFIISSATGGKGTVYLDHFQFRELAPPDSSPYVPKYTASSVLDPHHATGKIFDHDTSTGWHSRVAPEQQALLIDLQKPREYGGLIINWDSKDFAERYNVLISNDAATWDTAYSVIHGKGGKSYLYLKDQDSRFLKLELLKSHRGAGYGIREIEIKPPSFSENRNAFFTNIAKDYPRGYFPKYLYREQSYWTVVGVNGDNREALVNEEGMVEVDKTSFSIEPFIFNGNKLLTWNDTKNSQSLEKDYLPVPSIARVSNKIQLETKVFAAGEAGSSVLYLTYSLKNTSSDQIGGDFFLTIRPFQVNPPWQFLNWPGGISKITTIRYRDAIVIVNDRKSVISLTQPDGFGALEFDEGDITDFLAHGILPSRQDVKDHFEAASAAFRFKYHLAPGQSKRVYLAVPFHKEYFWKGQHPYGSRAGDFITQQREKITRFWENKINTIGFKLPPQADKLVNSIRSNLAYILINRDGPGIQPGSRSYERSWIRDGALTSSALLKMGIHQEVKEFLDWYSNYQFDNGKIPCVVDRRGPDPVPENDSNGEFIFAILQYFNFTGDTSFLRSKYENVRMAVKYLDHLIGQRSTDYYRDEGDSLRAFYGLLPESISHEGYSAKPMHSYWDDFFALKGLKDATSIAQILGEKGDAQHFAALRDTFRTNLYNSIHLAIHNHHIDYIPGCVELGDFDATSTAIAIYPCNELHNLPEPFARNTFDRYFDYFKKRLEPDFNWKNYTPYEIRLVGSFIYLNEISRAHRMLDFFFADQRPASWNQWAEVVWKDPKTPAFIGDMPHTWVGSDFISAARAMFVYEDEWEKSLVIGAGLYKDWLNTAGGMSVEGLPTYYGKLNYSVEKTPKGYHVELAGRMKLPSGNIKIYNWENSLPSKVMVNGTAVNQFNKDYIFVDQFPAEVFIEYP